MLTFNVAGLPRWIARYDGRETHPKIGAAIGPYTLVLLQEDFWYHERLNAPHPWQVRPRRGGILRLGDGLARLSHLPLATVEHVPWKASHGLFGAKQDKWAWKGFSAGKLRIDGKGEIWVYNVHFDAGGEDGDRTARMRQREQLIADIAERTESGDALILAGDFNCGPDDLVALIAAASLTDCGVGGIDRVLFRPGERVRLRVDGESSTPAPDVDALSGLSDHSAVWARLAVE